MKSNRNFFILLLIISLVGNSVLFYTSSRTNAKHSKIKATTHALHITKADGTKSIRQLIAEQGNETIPNQPIASFHFLVSPFEGSLVFPRVEPFQPTGFQWGILPGQDKKFLVPEINLDASEGLNFFLVKTETVCNVLIIIEYY